ncbi:MAG: hypothetical protein R3200_12020, partial [Xanthomonadales bacterium]|nr:hypothetical protein [Xanthomonadales bacterium]
MNDSFDPDDRLESWKRIAAYLDRDVRTLQRWEKSEGLPIHRQMHDKQATIYAYKSELDAWRAGRTLDSIAEPSTASKSSNRGALLVVIFLLAVITGAAIYWATKSEPDLPFEERDWVLITTFENRTGDEALDDVLDYALERELNASRFVNVVPRERINDTLRLMRKPLDSPIDVEIGREISLRDGGIKALLGGRIERIGNRYLLSVSLVHPADGVAVTSFSKEASNQDAILDAVSALSREVRQALGEELASIRARDVDLAKVTTPSLEALKLYSEGDRMMKQGWPDRYQALPLMEQAVRIDPNFASAHVMLFYLYVDRDQIDLANASLERAVQLAETAPDRERLFILSTYYTHYVRDFRKAIETNQLLIRMYPDHLWATGNIANAYEALGEYRQAHPYLLKLARMRPYQAWTQLHALQSSVLFNDREGVSSFAETTKALAADVPYLRPQLSVLPVHEAWLEGDLKAALARLDDLVEEVGTEALVANPMLYGAIRGLYLALGRSQRFLELSALRPIPGWFQALHDFDAGDPETLQRYLDHSIDQSYFDAGLLAWGNRPAQASRIIDSIEPGSSPRSNRAFRHQALGQLAVAEGRAEEAIEHFERAFHLLPAYWLPDYLFGAHTLARVHESQGSIDEAIASLEFARVRRDWSIFESATYLWMRNQVYLRALYQKAGREVEAEEVEADLRELLRL